MSACFLRDLARMTVAAAAGLGPITLGAAVPSFRTFDDSGVQNGEVVRYSVRDGNQRELGWGPYNATTKQITRNVRASTNNNQLVNLSAGAVVAIVETSEDILSFAMDQRGLFTDAERKIARDNLGAAAAFFPDGTAAAPGIAFAAEQGTGVFRVPGPPVNVGFSIGGVEAMRLSPTGLAIGSGGVPAVGTLDVVSTGALGFRSMSTGALGALSGGGVVAGTLNIPTAADQRIGLFLFGGVTTGTNVAFPAALIAYSAAPWSTGVAPSYLTLGVAGAGTAARTEAQRWTATGVSIPLPLSVTGQITGTGGANITSPAGVTALTAKGPSGAQIIADYQGGGSNFFDASTHNFRSLAGVLWAQVDVGQIKILNAGAANYNQLVFVNDTNLTYQFGLGGSTSAQANKFFIYTSALGFVLTADGTGQFSFNANLPSTSTTSGTAVFAGGIGVGGAVNAASINVGSGLVVIGPNVNGNIEIGGLNKTPFIDFHSSATQNDYDVRLIASGGDTSIGHGGLAVECGSFYVTSGTIQLALTSSSITLNAPVVMNTSQPAGGAGLTVAKARNATVGVRYDFTDVGGLTTDAAGGAFWRGIHFAAPMITDPVGGGNVFPRTAFYCEYNTLAAPTTRNWVLDMANDTATSRHTFRLRAGGADIFAASLTGVTFNADAFTLNTPNQYYPQIVGVNSGNIANGGYVILQKWRNGGANNGAVQVGDNLGNWLFSGKDQSGTFQNAAFVQATVTSVDASSVVAKLTFIIGAVGLAEFNTSGIVINVNTPATSTTTGALRAAGGISAGGAIYSGGGFVANDGTVNVRLLPFSGSAFLGTTTNHPLYIQTNNAIAATVNTDGSWLFTKPVTINGDSLSLTSAAAFLPNIFVENTANDATNGNIALRKCRTGAANNGAAQVGDQIGAFLFQAKDTSGNYRNAAYWMGTVTAVGASTVTGRLSAVCGSTSVADITTAGIQIYPTTPSTSTTSGALIVGGGIGAGGQVCATGFYAKQNGAQVTIDTLAAGQQSAISLWSNGTGKWQLGRNTDDTFFVYSIATAKSGIIIDAGANVSFPGGRVQVGNFLSGAQTGTVSAPLWWNQYYCSTAQTSHIDLFGGQYGFGITGGTHQMLSGGGFELRRDVSGAGIASTVALYISGGTGDVGIKSTTPSTSPSNGALKVDGGAGIGGALHVGAKVALYGNEGNQLEWNLGGQTWRVNIQSGGSWYVSDTTGGRNPLVLSAGTGAISLAGKTTIQVGAVGGVASAVPTTCTVLGGTVGTTLNNDINLGGWQANSGNASYLNAHFRRVAAGSDWQTCAWGLVHDVDASHAINGCQIWFHGNGGIGINNWTPDPKAQLDVWSTTKGFLPPRMTQAQRDAITGAPAGLIIFNTDSGKPNYYSGGWQDMAGAAGSSSLFRNLDADATGQNIGTAQPWFPATGAVSVAANTLYDFEGVLLMIRSTGTTAHSVNMSFGGTATLTALSYAALARNPGPTVTGNNQMANVGGASNTQVSGGSGSTSPEYYAIYVRGSVRVNAAGTLIPQFTFTQAPGGAPTIKVGTFFKLTALGAGNTTSSGTWS